MAEYRVLISGITKEKAAAYLEKLKVDGAAGKYLQQKLEGVDISVMEVEDFLELLVNTKRPQICAESAVHGDGSDWTHEELSILGDTSFAVPVTVFDNGRHQNPEVHQFPFEATLLFTPGALLRNDQGFQPVDWEECTCNGEINPDGYYRLYERRLLPPLNFANRIAEEKGRTAFITIPGIGCGQFAGNKFQGKLGPYLKESLSRILENHGGRLTHIKALYYDPYSQCDNDRQEINNVKFLVRPLTKGNEGKSQLCKPETYEEVGDDFRDCDLYSFVAWDHVSWPGNDFYKGSRGTDDGVKAAATSTMRVMTGFEGVYNPHDYKYLPPEDYANWEEVIRGNKIQLDVVGNLVVY